jgi:hypothetical protein
MVNEQKETRIQAQERSETSKGPKLPSTYWGVDATRIICTLCNVDYELELPQLWLSLADLGKRDRLAMEMVLTDIARQKGQVELAPIVTLVLVKRLVGLKLDGDNVEDLAEGMQPFALTISEYTSSSGEALAITAQRRADEYDLVTYGSVTTSLANAKALRGAGKASVVRDYSQARALMQAQNILHHAVLGPEHTLTKEFQGFVTAYSNRELYYQGRLSTTTSSALGPAKLLRYVQLRLVHCYREFHINGTLPDRAPDLKGLLRKLSYGDDSWILCMPITYEKAITGNGGISGGCANRTPGGSTISDLTGVTGSSSGPTGRSSGQSTGTSSGGANAQTGPGRARHLVTNSDGVKTIFRPFSAKINNMKVA